MYSSPNDAVMHAAGVACWWCTICFLTMNEWTAGQNAYAFTPGTPAARMSSLIWKSTSKLSSTNSLGNSSYLQSAWSQSLLAVHATQRAQSHIMHRAKHRAKHITFTSSGIADSACHLVITVVVLHLTFVIPCHGQCVTTCVA